VLFIEEAKNRAWQTREPAGTLVLHKRSEFTLFKCIHTEGIYGQPPKEVTFLMAYYKFNQKNT